MNIASKAETRDADRVLALSAGGISASSIELGANDSGVHGLKDFSSQWGGRLA